MTNTPPMKRTAKERASKPAEQAVWEAFICADGISFYDAMRPLRDTYSVEELRSATWALLYRGELEFTNDRRIVAAGDNHPDDGRNAELDEALRALGNHHKGYCSVDPCICSWGEGIRRIRELFARVRREKAAIFVKDWVHVDEVRGMLCELATIPITMPIYDSLDKAIDAILREHGYGGEP